jgi:threonine dehydrogenase-like Zn-dependent dehydrogenase
MKNHFEVKFTHREFAELVPLELELSSVPAGHIAGTTQASLISAGTELSYGYLGDEFPTSSGYASVFRVDVIGEGVEDFKIGDLSLALGNHRSFQVHPAKESWLVPQGLSPSDATFARLMGVSMSTLVTTTARPPARVIITGLGPVGHLAAQQFQACGYNVLAYDPDATRRELAERGGITQICGELPLQDPHWSGSTALVVECSGHEQAALDGCHLVQPRGEVVLIGVPWRQRSQITAHQLLHAVFHKYAVVRSGWEWEVPRHTTDFLSGSIQANIEAALKWLLDGKVRVSGLYSNYDPRDCQKAYQSLLNAQEKGLAIVFDWTKLAIQG